jgi:threonine/homoserine/homoserine lactone efflux protein
MLGIHNYWLFIATAIVLILTPGQDTFFILGRSLAGGRSSGVAAALGITAGRQYAFMAVKFAGAAYLIYIGVKALLSRASLPGADAATTGGQWSAFRQGIISNILNPKVALFFLALMPQFIGAASTNKVGAFLVLGFSFVAMGMVWCLVLAIAAARLRGAILKRPSMATILNRVAGAMFIALGLRLATARQ